MHQVTIGPDTVTIHPFSGRKVNRALRLLKGIAREVPDLIKMRAEFRRDYEAENFIELDRAQAMLRYGAPVALQDAEGNFVVDEAGGYVTVPSPIAEMTEAAWDTVGGKLRLPKSPSAEEEGFALFPEVMDRAEDLVVQLLALVLMPDDEVKRHARAGTLRDKRWAPPEDDPDAEIPESHWGELRKRGEQLLDDSQGEQLLEVAVVAGEILDEQLLSKARALRSEDRLGNLMGLFGQSRTESPEDDTTPAPAPATMTREPTPPSSSGSSEQDSPGEPATSSTSSTTSSSSSAG